MPSTPSPMPRGLLVLLTAAGAVVTVAGLRAASGIVGPAFLALVIVITIHPLLAWLQRHRVPSWLAVILTMLVAYASLLVLAAALVLSAARLATLLPSYQPQFTSLVDQFTGWLGERQAGAELLMAGSAILGHPRGRSAAVAEFRRAIETEATGVGGNRDKAG